MWNQFQEKKISPYLVSSVDIWSANFHRWWSVSIFPNNNSWFLANTMLLTGELILKWMRNWNVISFTLEEHLSENSGLGNNPYGRILKLMNIFVIEISNSSFPITALNIFKVYWVFVPIQSYNGIAKAAAANLEGFQCVNS